MRKIGVAVIGASPSGWAAKSHLPVLTALPEYDLRAVSTTRSASAEAAAESFDVPAAFDNHLDLIAHPGVDLVVVAVKVPRHHELVAAALDAGKMVYSEWPLGRDSAEAADLAARAEAAGVRTFIGLQARFNATVRHVRDLIADGYIGDVLATTLVSSGLAWGPETDHAHAYLYDAANGATTLSVAGLHALDGLHFALGEFSGVTASLVIGRPEVRLDDGSTLPVTSADQVALTGTLRGGAAVSVFCRGGVSRGTDFRWEINGSEGDLVLTSETGPMQVADLALAGGRGSDTSVSPIAVPDSYTADLPAGLDGPARNVAHTYVALAKDLRDGGHTVPGFAHALDRHRLIDAIERASITGSARTLLQQS